MPFPRFAAAPALAALLAAPSAGLARPSARVPLEPCQLAAPGPSSLRAPARCGTFEVPLVEPAPGEPVPAGAKTITLRLAVVESEAPRAERDAVVVLAGGPGQAATEGHPFMAHALERMARRRDIVLVDQRGTGGSGKLACPEVPQPGVGESLTPEGERAVVRACAEALAKTTDLDAYGSTTFARDLDRVREALGYEKLDLVGFSYGTRAALVYLREFPGRVRTMVLDGVAPFQMVIGGSFEEDGQAALEALLARCEAEAGCHGRFPALRQELEKLFATLSASPAKVTVRDALTAEPRTRSFGADQLRRVIVAFDYAAESSALLPPLLHAAAGGDLAPLAGALQIVASDIEVTIARPMQLSVLCAEDIPFLGPRREVARAGFLGNRVREEFENACSVWPVKPAPAAFREPVRSDVPALLLSGEADPVTPPRWAEMLAKDLPRSRHIVLRGQGHGVFFRGCVPRLAAAFVERGSADGLDTSCVERARPSPPFLDASGGSP